MILMNSTRSSQLRTKKGRYTTMKRCHTYEINHAKKMVTVTRAFIIYVQKAVFVTEDELNRVNGDVVPKIMPTNSEGIE